MRGPSQAALERLEAGPNRLRWVMGALSQAEAEKRRSELVRTARGCLRRLAVELHPDTHPDEPERAEQLKALTEAYEWLRRTRIDIRPPQRPRMQVFVPFGFGGTGTATTTSVTMGHGFTVFRIW